MKSPETHRSFAAGPRFTGPCAAAALRRSRPYSLAACAGSRILLDCHKRLDAIKNMSRTAHYFISFHGIRLILFSSESFFHELCDRESGVPINVPLDERTCLIPGWFH